VESTLEGMITGGSVPPSSLADLDGGCARGWRTRRWTGPRTPTAESSREMSPWRQVARLIGDNKRALPEPILQATQPPRCQLPCLGSSPTCHQRSGPSCDRDR
jgi:hypothetical protein